MAKDQEADLVRLTRPHMKRIKPSQARRGIYLDFEGFKDKSPSVVGILKEDEFRQCVLDPALAGVASHSRLEVLDLADLTRQLYETCESEKRFIIAFSEHELNVIYRESDIDISRRYKNAKRFASRWAARYLKYSELEGRSLADFLSLPEVDYHVPEHLAKGSATKWLRAVSDGLSKRGSWSELTDTQKSHWEKLLEYNLHDVLGLRALTLRASEELKR